MTKNNNNNNSNSNSNKKSVFWGWVYTNSVVFIGHPIERWKVSLQIGLGISPLIVTKEVISNYHSLYTALTSTILRQNSKYIYRAPLFVWMPQAVDEVVSQPVAAAVIKGSIGSLADTLIVTPVETIKTVQMKSMTGMKVSDAARSIYQTSGVFGFYRATRVSAIKSLPTWIHLFLGYQLTQSKHEKAGLMETVFWATLMSLPITFVTTPYDVIKTRQQAHLTAHSNKIFLSVKELVSSHGLFSLWRGFFARAAHKSLTTAGAYYLMNMAKESQLKK